MSEACVHAAHRTAQFAVPFAVLYGSWCAFDEEIPKLTIVLLPFSILFLIMFPGLSAGVIYLGAVIVERASAKGGWGTGYSPRVRMVLAALLGGLAGVVILAVVGEILAALEDDRDQWLTANTAALQSVRRSIPRSGESARSVLVC